MTLRRMGIRLQQDGGISLHNSTSMAQQACWIEINGNKMPAGSKVKPEQRLTFVADLGIAFGDKVRFTLRDNISGASWIGPVEVSSFFHITGGWARYEVTMPVTEAAVTLVSTEIRPLLPDDTKTFPFIISLSAPDPPPPKKPFSWDSLIPWVIGGGILIALVALSPSINRGVGRIVKD